MSMISGEFSEKRVLITGASRGIGFAVAEEFLLRGAEVSVLAQSDKIHEVAASLSRIYGTEVAAIQCDISDRALVETLLPPLETYDILINNAGLEYITPIDDTGDAAADKFRQIIEINILGTYYVTRAILPKMKAGGRIIFTSSIWGHTAVPEFGAYCASKHGIIGFMRSLAQELGPKHITVNAVCPGWVRTDAAMQSLKFMSERYGRTEADLLKEIVGAQAIDGLLETVDVTSPYLYFASEGAKNITGQTLNVDRGEVMG